MPYRGEIKKNSQTPCSSRAHPCATDLKSHVEFTESPNPRIFQDGRDLKAPLIPPLPRAGTFPALQGAPSPVQPALDVYKNDKPSLQLPNHTFFSLSQTNHGKHSRAGLQALEPAEKDLAVVRGCSGHSKAHELRGSSHGSAPSPALGLCPASLSASVLCDHGGSSPRLQHKYPPAFPGLFWACSTLQLHLL